MKEINSIELYDCMFSFLDAYWRLYKTPDDLGGLLSSMNRNLFAGSDSADSAILESWREKHGDLSRHTPESGFEAVIVFIQRHSDWLELAPLVSNLDSAAKDQTNLFWRMWVEHFTRFAIGS